MSLSIPQARAELKNALEKAYVGGWKKCVYLDEPKYGYTPLDEELYAVSDVHIREAGYRFVFGGRLDNPKQSVKFRNGQDYIQTFRLTRGYRNYHSTRPLLYCVDYVPGREKQFEAAPYWTDEAAAREFADAFNRLLYAAHRDEEYPAFSAAAKTWRENPVKLPLNPEADREWILAENAVKEKNLDSAVDHYEAALEIQPTWPTGWFDLAMIYAEQKNFADAADAMKHYLELVPDAPDAKDARTQMIIWEDKASKPQ